MKLITTTEQLRSFLGAAYSASDDINRIMPYLDLAEDNVIAKALGPELLTYLKDTVAPNESAANEHYKYLLGLIRRAQAFYGYAAYLPYATGNDGNNGLQETKTEKTQPVRQAMLEKRIAATAENAATSLESALYLLFTKAENYPTFATSATYLAACELFIRNATELKKACPYTRGYYRLYLSMREYMEERQRKSIVPALGADYCEQLLEAQKNDDLTEAETRLMPYIQRALGYAAYEDSMMFLNVVQLPSGGLRVLSEFDGINNQRALSDQDKLFCEYKRTVGLEAEANLKELKRYLDAHADELPDYIPTPVENRGQTWPVDNTKYKTIIRLR
ncbi:DUF6712 family protein [Runella salmonicolor]|uniref:Uncharacterized protein n=1 Tax=Runella salmonicolor TaxID=2950278 RepID=A0ABT1FSG4_9BACT|nr:DUF6712 family protein [Runella salmonicolor]MCP1384440.1 hypothetical protein [Runella salmonicolor]